MSFPNIKFTASLQMVATGKLFEHGVVVCRIIASYVSHLPAMNHQTPSDNDVQLHYLMDNAKAVANLE